MGNGALSQEQIEAARAVIEKISEVAKIIIEKFKVWIIKASEVFKEHRPLFEYMYAKYERNEKQKLIRQKFEMVKQIKGKILKSQVQNKKPKFVQARSRL